MSSKIPKSINLLDPVAPPEDMWEKLYDWLFNFGKYILISVEAIVLVVFIARFSLDRKNNDLTDQINAQVATLEQPKYRQDELKFKNFHELLREIKKVSDNQQVNSTVITSILNSVPAYLDLQNVSYSSGTVSIVFTADSFEDVKKYESLLRTNPLYEDLNLNLSKSGDKNSKVDFAVTFNIKSSN